MVNSDYVGTRHVGYENGTCFVAACPKCGRFVKADKTVSMNEAGGIKPNATCAKHGRVVMPFEGYF